MARARTWTWLRGVGTLLVVVAAIEYGAVPLLVAASSDLHLLRDLSVFLVLLAVALEAASLVAYTLMTQQLLGEDETLPFGTQLRIDVTGNGLSRVLPGGGAASAAVRYRLMVARGVTPAAAASLAGVETVLALVGLVVLGLLGSIAALPRSGVTATGVVMVVLAVSAAVVLGWLARPRRRTPRLLRAAAGRIPPTLSKRLRAVALEVARTLRDSDAVRAALAWSVTNWLLDALCLWICLRGYGARTSVELVLVAYAVAMLVGSLPLTPGGLGVVEGLLVPGLLAAGAPSGAAVLGVLSWRLLEYWLAIPLGLALWASLSWRWSGRVRVRRRERADPVGEPAPDGELEPTGPVDARQAGQPSLGSEDEREHQPGG